MGDFQNQPVQLDVTSGTDNQGALGAFPRILQISVSDAQQVFPNQGASVNTVLLFGGTARFGQPEDAPADPENSVDGSIMVADGNLKTLYLRLHFLQQQFLSNSLAGSASFAALNSAGLSTNEVFGVSVNNAVTELTESDPKGKMLTKDFWLFSDVFAEEDNGLNRLGYQATVLLQTQSLATPTGSEIAVPHAGNVVDLDVAAPDQVASPGALDVGIQDGLQVLPAVSGTNGANRLLIFTGTAVCNVMSPLDDNILFAAVVRVRLRFPMPATLILKGSATVAALASIHGNHDIPSLFGVNAARIVADPTDGGTLSQPPQPLPDGELYLLAEVRALGADNGVLPGVLRLAYQANVLVKDTLPDLDSILVRPAGAGAFTPLIAVTVDGVDVLYDIQLNLNGPLPANSTFNVSLDSSEPQNVLVLPLVVLTQQTTVISNNLIVANTVRGLATITARGRRVIRRASIEVSHLT